MNLASSKNRIHRHRSVVRPTFYATNDQTRQQRFFRETVLRNVPRITFIAPVCNSASPRAAIANVNMHGHRALGSFILTVLLFPSLAAATVLDGRVPLPQQFVSNEKVTVMPIHVIPAANFTRWRAFDNATKQIHTKATYTKTKAVEGEYLNVATCTRCMYSTDTCNCSPIPADLCKWDAYRLIGTPLGRVEHDGQDCLAYALNISVPPSPARPHSGNELCTRYVTAAMPHVDVDDTCTFNGEKLSDTLTTSFLVGPPPASAWDLPAACKKVASPSAPQAVGPQPGYTTNDEK